MKELWVLEWCMSSRGEQEYVICFVDAIANAFKTLLQLRIILCMREQVDNTCELFPDF